MLKKRLCALGVFMFWASLAAGSEAIDAKYKAIGAATLGKPAGAEKSSAGGRVRLYAKGGIWSSKAGGTHAVVGPTFDKYKSLGAEKGKLGFPVTDVMPSAGGTQTLFRRGYILGDKSGALNAQVTPNTTFTADGATFSGATKMKSPTEAFFEPELPAVGGTVTCSCTPNPPSLEIGRCAISTNGPSSIKCSKGSCRIGCMIVIVKGAS